MSDAPFVTLVVDDTSATTADIEETTAAVRDQGVAVDLLFATGGSGFHEAATEARGTFIGVLTAGEALVPGAVASLERATRSSAGVDVAYGDEVILAGPGGGARTVVKPAWSPERLLGQDWLGHPTLYRTSLVRSVCAERRLGAAWEHDLAIRVAAGAAGVVHVAEPLLRGRGRTLPAAADTARTVGESLAALGTAAHVEAGPVPGSCVVSRTLPDGLSATVVVPCQAARGLAWGERRWFAVEAVRSVLEHGGHANIEVVVVHHRTLDLGVRAALLALDDRVRLVETPGAPGRAAMVNRGVLESNSDAVVLLDEHAEVIGPGFLTAILGPLLDEGVGVTGARILGPDGRLRSTGDAFYGQRSAPMNAGVLASDDGPDGMFRVPREVSGVGGGCVALRRDTFLAVGGLSERLELHNDVHLSHKARQVGLRRIWVPTASAYQLLPHPLLPPSALRAERQWLRERWRAGEVDDYSPEFPPWRRDEHGAGAGTRRADQRTLVENRSSTSV